VSEEPNFKNSVIFKIHYLVRLSDRWADKKLQELANLSLSQFLLLSMIKCPQVTNQKQIAVWLGVTEVAISKQVEQLEKLGYIEKQIRQPDRKQKLWQLTTQGQQRFELATSVMNNLSQQWQEFLEPSEIVLFQLIVDKLLFKLKLQD